jgi:hypothetical protein
MTLAFPLLASLVLGAPAASEIDADLARRLSSRHGIDCATLGAATPALRDALLALTDPDLKPSSVPVRAAACLAQVFGSEDVVRARVLAWIADPGTQGLALAAVGAEGALAADTSFRAAVASAIAAIPEAERRERLERRAAR